MSSADAPDTAGAVTAPGTSSPGSPPSIPDKDTAAPLDGARAESTPFTGQIVHNRDGSLVIVDADVPWVSEPDSIVDDGGTRGRSTAIPPTIGSVLFIGRRRSARVGRAGAAARAETEVPQGLIVDRYRVCDADDGSGDGSGDGPGGACGASGADVACGVGGAPEVSSSAPERTNITCCVCRLCFGAVAAFVAHCAGAHRLVLDESKLRLLGRSGAAAVLTAGGSDRRPTVSLLKFSPSPSDSAQDGATGRAAANAEGARCVGGGSGEVEVRSGHPSVPSYSVSAEFDICGSRGSSGSSRPGAAAPTPDGSPAHVSTGSATTDLPGVENLSSPQLAITSQAAAGHGVPGFNLKTLKCPRCNWHFKYRDTLEVHLREKHPEGGGACGFCRSGQPHPRLSRGEAHDCGYKPYRCDVCRYATTTKGNLSIHMQSDKHLNNMQERQRVLRNLCSSAQESVDGETSGQGASGKAEDKMEGDERPSLMDIVQGSLRVPSSTSLPSPAGRADALLGEKIAMWLGKHSATSECDQDASKGSKRQAGDHAAETQTDWDPNPQHIYTCCTCATFSTDSLEDLDRHVRRDRSNTPAGEFTSLESGSHMCHLCSYRTHLRANFQLHCQSDKHLQKLQHLNHILEGGPENLWQLRYLHAASPTAVRCNLCDFSAGVGTQLRVHAVQPRHEASHALFAYLRGVERAVPAARRRYGCALCDYSTRHVLLLLRHVTEPLHLARERRRQLVSEAEGSAPADGVTAFCSVWDAGSAADDGAGEKYKPANNHMEQELEKCEKHTNGTADAESKKLRNLKDPDQQRVDDGLSVAHHSAGRNGLGTHGVKLENASHELGDLKPEAEEAAGMITRNDEKMCKLECDKDAVTDIFRNPNPRTSGMVYEEKLKIKEHGIKVTQNKFHAVQKEMLPILEGEGRPYKCHSCNVSYGHPQILNIHLQSALHQARVGSESLRSYPGGLRYQPGATPGQDLANAAGTLATGKGQGVETPALMSVSEVKKDREVLLAQGTAADTLGRMLTSVTNAGREDADTLTISSALETCGHVADLTTKSYDAGQHVHLTGPRSTDRPASMSKTSCGETQKLSAAGRDIRSVKNQLLEAYGLELVMHHCESRRKKRKINSEEPSDDDDVDEAVPGGRKKQASEGTFWPCHICHKKFTDMWILKVHLERVHQLHVSKDLLEAKVEVILVELRKRHLASSAGTKKDLGSQHDEAFATTSQYKPKAVSELSSPVTRSVTTPSDATRDTQANTSSNTEQDHEEEPSALPQLPVADIQTALSFMQAAAHFRYQMQQMNPLLASQMAALAAPLATFGLGEVGAPPSLLPLMAAQQLLNPGMLWAAQAQALAQQQQAQKSTGNSSKQHSEGKRTMGSAGGDGREEKRARTRISGHQVKVLRAFFDVNCAPSEEEVKELAKRCGLAPRVVKHWFRNTLFKERQRDKNSPYNFNIPPATTLDMGQQGRAEQANILKGSPSQVPTTADGMVKRPDCVEAKERTLCSPKTVASDESGAVDLSKRTPSLAHHSSLSTNHSQGLNSEVVRSVSPPPAHNGSLSSSLSSFTGSMSSGLSWGAPVTREFGELSVTLPSHPSHHPSASPGNSSSLYRSTLWSELSPSDGQKGGSKRANRTRFTDQQVKVLQDFFEKNAYPKEEDLRRLSKILNLGPRVIVVWFQNARQKVRKVFENQPPAERVEEKPCRFQRTAELHYQCTRCQAVYQRYHELVRHQRQQCYREESARQRSKSQEPRSETATPAAEDVKPTPQDSTYKCGKCPQEFDRFDRWREHQVLHVMNPSVVPSSRQNQFSGCSSGTPAPRPPHSAEEASDGDTDDAVAWDRHTNDRRLRTSINPEQLEVLHRAYLVSPTPSRETIEAIARGTGLKKRVVQVWFQNARARERKSQAVRQVQVPSSYQASSEVVVKTKVLEPKLGPEVSVELVRTYPKTVPSGPVARQNGGREEARTPLDRLTSLGNTVIEACLLPQSSQPTDAPLDLSKSHLSVQPVSQGLTTKPVLRDALKNPQVRRDIPPSALPSLIPTREGAPWPNHGSANPTGAPSPLTGPSVAAPARPPFSVANKRFRTQMSPAQVSVLRSVFAAYRMPTMAECARLGSEIGLAKRVVQVWFQNSRAKEKKRQLQSGRPPTPPPQGCDLCGVVYGAKCSLQEHLLSRAHIERVQRDSERARTVPPAASSGARTVDTGAVAVSTQAASDTAGTTSPSVAPAPIRSAAITTSTLTMPDHHAALTMQPARESARDAVVSSSRHPADSKPPQLPAVSASLRPALSPAGGASVRPTVNIDGATCDPPASRPAVSASVVPMATSAG